MGQCCSDENTKDNEPTDKKQLQSIDFGQLSMRSHSSQNSQKMSPNNISISSENQSELSNVSRIKKEAVKRALQFFADEPQRYPSCLNTQSEEPYLNPMNRDHEYNQDIDDNLNNHQSQKQLLSKQYLKNLQSNGYNQKENKENLTCESGTYKIDMEKDFLTNNSLVKSKRNNRTILSPLTNKINDNISVRSLNSMKASICKYAI